MNQFSLEGKTLKLMVEKRSIAIRTISYFITFLCFALPIFMLTIDAKDEEGIHFVSIVLLGLFSLIGFYVLRLSLWNHYGTELINFDGQQISYTADYGWFKDKVKTLENKDIVYSIKFKESQVNDNKVLDSQKKEFGVLVISNGISEIESVVDLPAEELDRLIELLKSQY
jgi:hypothetical protein